MTLDYLLLGTLTYLLSVVVLVGWLDASHRPIPPRLRTGLAIYVAPAVAVVAAGLECWVRVREE